jgi:nitrate/nitrite-specific signal transduction histidine kinase
LIRLIWSVDYFTMSMADDRIGFDPKSAQTVGHYGLMMRELEKALRGELKVDISPGQGTQLNFRIPLVYLQTSDKSEQTLPICPSTPMTCHVRRD